MAENVTIGQLPVQGTANLTDIVEIERPGEASYQMSLQAIVTLANDEAPAPVWGTIVGDLTNQTDLQNALDLKLDDAPSDGTIYGRQDAAWVEVQSSTVWGAITGTLSDQTDLQAALDAKANQATTYTKTETDNLLAAKAPIANPVFTGSFTSPGIDDNGSSTALTIDGSDRVIIGATAAASSSTLTVADDGNTFAQFAVRANNGQKFVIGANDNSNRGYLQADGGIQFLVNSLVSATEGLRVNADTTVVLANLAGSGTRNVQVQADGTLIAV